MLSVVIPCYNSKETLEEALSSVYAQNIQILYEIIMVDDGSTDGTRDLIISLCRKYKYARYVFHDQNKGGGAARNTGIAHAKGRYVFCLDSDNFFPPNTLGKMVSMIEELRCDAVVIHERRFFYDSNKNTYEKHENTILDRSITLQDMFDDSNVLLDNFLFTKDSFYRTKGYPEEHGFDTQSFEVRFLANNPKVLVCSGSVFYHRVHSKNKSYFQRVYENGELSLNCYLMYEDIMHLFSKDVRLKIAEYDIFKNSKLGTVNLQAMLRHLYKENSASFFLQNKEEYMQPDGFEKYVYANKASDESSELLCRAIYYQKSGKCMSAVNEYANLLQRGVVFPIIYYNILRCLVGLEPNRSVQTINRCVNDIVKKMAIVSQKYRMRPSFLRKVVARFPRLGEVINKIIS